MREFNTTGPCNPKEHYCLKREKYLKAQERVLSLSKNSSLYPFLLYLGAWEREKIFQQSQETEPLWEEFLSLEVSDLILKDARRWLYYRARRWEELKSIWQEFLEKISSQILSSALLARQGFYSESFLGAPRDARLEYERALQLNPNHAMARSQLMDLIEKTRTRGFESSS
mgnify:CR=1 FL=1